MVQISLVSLRLYHYGTANASLTSEEYLQKFKGCSKNYEGFKKMHFSTLFKSSTKYNMPSDAGAFNLKWSENDLNEVPKAEIIH